MGCRPDVVSLRPVASRLSNFYDRVRHPAARTLASERPTVFGFDHLRGHKYCLLLTYKRNGAPISTPVWFGLRHGRLYVRTDADAAKVRRVRKDQRVRVAPCTARGKPLGPPAQGRARVLDDDSDIATAEAALEANYGLGRTLYERTGAVLGAVLGVEAVYVEVAPL
jgi:PPOX class probable F420-dependent enzyme